MLWYLIDGVVGQVTYHTYLLTTNVLLKINIIGVFLFLGPINISVLYYFI